MSKLFFILLLMFGWIGLPLFAQTPQTLQSEKEKLLACSLIYSASDECEKDQTTQTWICNKKLKQFKIINGEAVMSGVKITVPPETKEACSKGKTYCYQGASGKVFVKDAPVEVIMRTDAEINEEAFECSEPFSGLSTVPRDF